MNPDRFSLGRCVFVAVLTAFGLGAGGCSVVGVVASKATRTMITPSYKKLAGESIGVMVTADPGILIDFPKLQLDVAQAVQAKFMATQANKADELKGTTFPTKANPAAIVAFQRNYPQYDLDPIETVAPRFGVSRLVVIEIDLLSLNPADVMELFRGEMSGRVRVLEVAGGKATSGFEDQLTAVYPEDEVPEGNPNLTRGVTYRGLVDAIATAVVRKFVAYETNE